MKPAIKNFGSFRFATWAMGLAATIFLTGCATPPATPQQAVYKFQVLRYPQAVEVKHWSVDPAQSANPEGAALNITAAMQQGDVNQWLADWDSADRPTLNAAAREKLVAQWQSLKNGRVLMLGRVVAGSDLVLELSVQSAQRPAQELKLPLKHENGQWWLTSMDTNSEFMNWEYSTNKIMTKMDTRGLEMYLAQFKEARR
jgi:hypothetical protein